MKKIVILLSMTMTIGLIFIPSCGKKTISESPESTGTTAADSTKPVPIPPKIEPVPNHKVQKINLGIVESFAMLAYTSISSTPTSSIKGKVGLKPGIRSLINLDPKTEVLGGSTEIYAGDDIGDSSDYLNFARANLIAAYKDASSRPADKDKIEAYAGKPGDKILPAGIYQWSNGVTISSDVTLEGTSTDVYIFQITGNMDIDANVRVNLSGGVRAKNVFWQVSGKVTLGSGSVVPGNIMSQLTLEMKNLAQLKGRALVKNGKILLSQNTITKPEL